MAPVLKIIQPNGLFDGDQGTKCRQKITELVENGTDIVLLDFQDVTFMDSSGLGAVVLSLKTVRASGGKLFICSINDQIRMLFELTSMDRVFQIFANREEFTKEMASSKHSH